MLRPRMQHMIQKPDARVYRDLLRRGELRRVRCICRWFDSGACAGGRLEVWRGFVGWESAAVEGK